MLHLCNIDGSSSLQEKDAFKPDDSSLVIRRIALSQECLVALSGTFHSPKSASYLLSTLSLPTLFLCNNQTRGRYLRLGSIQLYVHRKGKK